MDFFQNDTKTAFEAKEAAQWIAFGPMVFQSARVLRNSGILSAIEEGGEEGVTIEDITRKVNLPPYGVRVLLESGLSMKLFFMDQGKYKLAKTGYFILHDDLTITNMDFVHDVCYKGLFSLDKSIESGKPEGLKEFGAWKTIYEGLSQLPDHVKKSWFSFDHFFSDNAFPLILSRVLKNGPKNILDIGGNTGKWAIACTQYSNDTRVTILDLPGQLEIARREIEKLDLMGRVSFWPANILDEQELLPSGHDAIWMSQFLDCFSEAEIVVILRKCYHALDDSGSLFILEPFWDKQRFEIAAFCLQQTSLYFTALANGNSQMYHSETFIRCIHTAGFTVVEQKDNIGLSQTLLKCNKRKEPQ
jgi:ubiquinone/menaquinone biosynthesis C-methylase UbiE